MIWRNFPLVVLFRRGWMYARAMRGIFLLYLGMFVLAQIFTLLQPYVLGRILNAVQVSSTPAQALDEILYYSGWYLLLLVLFWSLHYPARILEMRTTFQIRINNRQDLFDKLIALPLAWHRDHPTGESVDRINRSASGLYQFLASGFQVLYAITEFVTVLVILSLFMLPAGIAAMVMSLVTFVSISLFDRVLNRDYRYLNQTENRIASALHDYISNIVTVVALRVQRSVSIEVLRRLVEPLKRYRRHTATHEAKWCVMSMCSAALLLGIPIWYASDATARGEQILAGTFFTLFEYLRRLSNTFFSFSMLYGTIQRQAADVQNADSIIEAFDALHVGEAQQRERADWKRVEIEDLSFSYEQGADQRSHLDSVAVTLHRPGKIALVGSSGGGKSTILKLLRGLHEGADARVRIDGVEDPLGLAALYPLTALIPQDPEIFIDTIRFNVTFGTQADDEAVLEALRAARFDQVLARLPRGLDTHLAEKGVNLSGGEKQRLALARGLFLSRDSEIILLDESTSSVDSLNERRIFDNLWERFRDRCIVAAIHRLHLLEKFDTVYVLQNGVVAEVGTFASLIAANGPFAELWRHYQAEESHRGG